MSYMKNMTFTDEIEAALSDVLEEPTSAWSRQEAGSHYTNLTIQPMEYSLANNLNAAQHTAIKYVTRYRDKNGIEDLRKAIHTIEMLIEFEQRDA